MKPPPGEIRNLVLVLGDQLSATSSAFDNADSGRDAVLMMEVAEEATYIRQHKLRIALFFSAMRHFRDELVRKGWRVIYRQIDDPENQGSFAAELDFWARLLTPRKIVVLQPGDFRVQNDIQNKTRELGVELDIRDDRSFFCSHADFAEFSKGSNKLILEYFCRRMRKQHGVLFNDREPEGGRWNFDAENRQPITSAAIRQLKPLRGPSADTITSEVIAVVEKRFSSSPGRLDHFDYPVTRSEAKKALREFIAHRLDRFGAYQDAMSRADPYLFHSRLSSSINLHLLDPGEVVSAVLDAYRNGLVPLSSTEGFVRQILGWREFVRGIYWKYMPGYSEMNALDAQQAVPAFFWTGETDMNCVRHAVGSLIDHAYTHHIERLMVLGLFSLLLGVVPRQFHDWHISMFADAIDWVSLPNALGMSQFGDGGIIGTKPYCASGSYINRMSGYCKECHYDPAKATGEEACPFTTLYWDFLARNRERFAENNRMQFQIKNLARRSQSELVQIHLQADRLQSRVAQAKSV